MTGQRFAFRESSLECAICMLTVTEKRQFDKADEALECGDGVCEVAVGLCCHMLCCHIARKKSQEIRPKTERKGFRKNSSGGVILADKKAMD